MNIQSKKLIQVSTFFLILFGSLVWSSEVHAVPPQCGSVAQVFFQLSSGSRPLTAEESVSCSATATNPRGREVCVPNGRSSADCSFRDFGSCVTPDGPAGLDCSLSPYNITCTLIGGPLNRRQVLSTSRSLSNGQWVRFDITLPALPNSPTPTPRLTLIPSLTMTPPVGATSTPVPSGASPTQQPRPSITWPACPYQCVGTSSCLANGGSCLGGYQCSATSCCCDFGSNLTGTPFPTASTAPQPTPGSCVNGAPCDCDGLNGRDPPESCGQCGGQWCNGGACSCAPPPPPPPGPPPSATPTPVQPSLEITAPPTPSINPLVITPTPMPGQNPVATMSQRWVCLDVQACSAGGCSGQGTVDHRVKIQAKVNDAKPLSRSDTYIFECLRIPDPNRPNRTIQKCTTGNQSVDNSTVGSTILPELQRSVGYEYSGIFRSDGLTRANNPVPPSENNSGNFGQREWESFTRDNINRMFYAMNWYDPNGPEAGDIAGQKQGTLSFDQSSKKCVMIRWDPRGIVIDSRSLKPLSDVQVTLLKKDTSGSFVPITDDDVLGGGLQNPYITKEDGAFAFYVPDGTYKITAKKENYTSFTSKEINQKGKIYELNISLEPKIKDMILDKVTTLLKKALDIIVN